MFAGMLCRCSTYPYQRDICQTDVLRFAVSTIIREFHTYPCFGWQGQFQHRRRQLCCFIHMQCFQWPRGSPLHRLPGVRTTRPDRRARGKLFGLQGGRMTSSAGAVLSFFMQGEESKGKKTAVLHDFLVTCRAPPAPSGEPSFPVLPSTLGLSVLKQEKTTGATTAAAQRSR